MRPPILDGVTTTPRWLREQRRAARRAAGRPGDSRDLPFKRVDWATFGFETPLSEDEWAAFIGSIEEAKGRPLVG